DVEARADVDIALVDLARGTVPIQIGDSDGPVAPVAPVDVRACLVDRHAVGDIAAGVEAGAGDEVVVDVAAVDVGPPDRALPCVPGVGPVDVMAVWRRALGVGSGSQP